MRILILTRAFNSLSQRLFVELEERGHIVSVEYDIDERTSVEAIDLFQPDLIVGSFLTRKIPESIWRRVKTLIVHPGPIGDRGPSSLDWAILDGVPRWGVTVLQADDGLDTVALDEEVPATVAVILSQDVGRPWGAMQRGA